MTANRSPACASKLLYRPALLPDALVAQHAYFGASYRLTPSVMHPAHVQDAATATAWVVDNIAPYGGDPENVYVAGHSAGAYLAALLTLDPTHLGAHPSLPTYVRHGARKELE